MSLIQVYGQTFLQTNGSENLVISKMIHKWKCLNKNCNLIGVVEICSINRYFCVLSEVNDESVRLLTLWKLNWIYIVWKDSFGTLQKKEWAYTKENNFWDVFREITAVNGRIINADINYVGKIKFIMLSFAACIRTTRPYRVKPSFETQFLTSEISLNN